MQPVEKNKVTRDKSKSVRSSFFSGRFRYINPLHLLVGACAIIMGLSVVYLSMFGYIQPLWVATAMSMFGSVTTMIGAYFMYDILSSHHQLNSLVKEAIKRVISDQN